MIQVTIQVRRGGSKPWAFHEPHPPGKNLKVRSPRPISPHRILEILHAFPELTTPDESWLGFTGDRHHDGPKRLTARAITATFTLDFLLRPGESRAVLGSVIRDRNIRPLEKKTHPKAHSPLANGYIKSTSNLRQRAKSAESICRSVSAYTRLSPDPISSTHPKCGVPGYKRYDDESPPHELGGPAARSHEELARSNAIDHGSLGNRIQSRIPT